MMSNRAKGGKARAASLTPAQRSEIARRGGQARWRRARERQPAVALTYAHAQPGHVEVTAHVVTRVYGRPGTATTSGPPLYTITLFQYP